MALKKISAKTSKAPAPREAADAEPHAAPPKVTRRRSRAAAPAVPAVPAHSATRARPVTDDDIRVRAYFLALESQGRGGSLDYWLRAERELRAGAGSAD